MKLERETVEFDITLGGLQWIVAEPPKGGDIKSTLYISNFQGGGGWVGEEMEKESTT